MPSSRRAPIHEQLMALDAGLHQLAADLSGFGVLDDDDSSRESVTTDLEEDLRHIVSTELVAAQAHITKIMDQLRDRHPAYVGRQLARADIQSAKAESDLKLSLTGKPPPGWLGVGFPPAADVAISLLWGLPFDDASASFVYFALALEHFFYRDDALRVLREVRRVLKQGGVLRVVVPDMEKYLRAYVEGDHRFFESHRQYWSWAKETRTPLDIIHVMAGTGLGCAAGNFFAHKAGYDLETLTLLLNDAGFTNTARRAYLESPHPELGDVDRMSHDAGYGDGENNFNLFVEAW